MVVSAKISNVVPSAKGKSITPHAYLSNFQTGHAGEGSNYVTAGTPIGLLLVLTYAANQFLDRVSYGPRPNVRILNT